MSITRHFEYLGAPLRNCRWSWGAIDKKGRTIVRAWRDETREVNGGTYILVARHSAYQSKQSHPGYRERMRHIESLKEGGMTYALLVEAKDPVERPRAIKSFDKTQLWRLGDVIEISGEEYAQIVEAIKIADFLAG